MLAKPFLVVVPLLAAFTSVGGCATGTEDPIVTNIHEIDGGYKTDASSGGSSNKGGSAGNGASGGSSKGGSGGSFAGSAGAQGACTTGEEKQYGDCGNCGVALQKCEAGNWGPVQCQGEGECKEGEEQTQDCTGGTQTRTCNAACEWDAWSSCSSGGACTPGNSESVECNNCGQKTRTCDANGQWGSFGACANEGECKKGTTETADCPLCAKKTRTCDDTCHWGDYGPCSGGGSCNPGDTEEQDCTKCGKQVRTCSSSCQWGSYGGCQNQGECEKGESGSDCMCSTLNGITHCCGEKTCGNDCTWSSCEFKSGMNCEWKAGSNWRCCGGGDHWEWCLPSCEWSGNCASCNNCC